MENLLHPSQCIIEGFTVMLLSKICLRNGSVSDLLSQVRGCNMFVECHAFGVGEASMMYLLPVFHRTHYVTIDFHHPQTNDKIKWIHFLRKDALKSSSCTCTSLSAQGLRGSSELPLRASHVHWSHLPRQRDQLYCQLILFAIDVRIFGLETCPMFCIRQRRDGFSSAFI